MNKTQAFVFFGIVLVGLCISLITLKKFGKPVEVDGPDEPAPAVVETPLTPPKEDPKKPTPDTPEPSVAKSTEAPKEKPEEVKQYKSADALLGALSDSVKNRDAKQFFKMAGPKAATPLIEAQVSKLIADPSFEVDESRPTAQVAKVAGSFSRWAIRLKKKADAKLPEGAPEIAEIYTDVISKPDLGWTVEKVALPIEVAEFIGEVDMTGIAATVDPANPTAPGTPTTPNATKGGDPKVPAPTGVESADALTVAHAFSKAVVDRNFNLARGMTDKGTITDERVAALMIAVEEGQFKLRQDEPLVVTLNRENIVWVLTRIETNPSDSSKSEFALEMAKIDNEWKINGLAFNALLTALADKAGAGGTAYAPMVKNPKGGESLVIYFDFDNKEVTSRANRQLKIVATILKENPERKIRINGHADALGTDEYNKSLSNSRSAGIRKALLDLGVAPNQVVTESFGETQPLRPNFKSDGTDDPSGRSQNRRAEVYLDF